MKAIIEIWDGEYAVRLPDELLEAQGLRIGDEIEIELLDSEGRPRQSMRSDDPKRAEARKAGSQNREKKR